MVNPAPAPLPPEVVALDERADHRLMLGVTAALAVLISVLVSVQSVLVLGVFSQALSGDEPVPMRELAVRIAVNLTASAVLVGGVAVVRPERYRPLGRIVAVLVPAAVASMVRGFLQATVGIYDIGTHSGSRALITELMTALVLLVIAELVGLLFVALWRSGRRAERMRVAAQEHAFQLLRELQDEELRIRREIAETIHGSVQGIFVVLEARLRRLAEVHDAERAELEDIAAQIGSLREGELRTLSGRLYPVDLARGTDAALRALYARLPAWVTVGDEASDVLAAAESRLSLEARVVVVRVVEEALSNALRHGGARAIEVTAEAGAHRLDVRVDSDGAVPREGAASGLARLGRRAAVLGGTVELHPGERGGAVLRLSLPLPA